MSQACSVKPPLGSDQALTPAKRRDPGFTADIGEIFDGKRPGSVRSSASSPIRLFGGRRRGGEECRQFADIGLRRARLIAILLTAHSASTATPAAVAVAARRIAIALPVIVLGFD